MKFNKLIPELSVNDFQKSLDFYTKLGFEIEYQREGFAFLSLQGSQIMIEEKNGHWETASLEKPYGRGINFQIEVAKIGPILERLKDVKLFKEPMENWYKVKDKEIGQKEFLVQDPDGYLLRFAQDIGTKN